MTKTFKVLTLLFAASLPCCLLAQSDTDYYRHTVFDNSLTPNNYFYSAAMANGGSFVEQIDSRLPVETKTFVTPPNALRLGWQSQPGGGWVAEVRVMNFRNRFPEFAGHNLYFWVYAPQAISAADLPSIVLSTAREGLQVAEFPASFTDPLPIGKFTGDLPAGRGCVFAFLSANSILPRSMISALSICRMSSSIKNAQMA